MKLLVKIGFVACLLLTAMASANENELKEVRVEIALLCSPGKELENLKKVIPAADSGNTSYEEWTQNFVLTMQKMYELIQSGNVGNAGMRIGIADANVANPE